MRDINTNRCSFRLSKLTRGHKLSALAAVLLLAACGGGGGGVGSSGGGASQAPGANGGALSFSGSVAVGAAVVNAPVTVKCAGPAQAATTTSDLGRYSVTMPVSAKLPCVLRAVGPNGSLHAPVSVTWQGGEVNLTPLTDLLLTQSAGRLAESFFDTFRGSEDQLSDASLNAAHKEVVDVFRPLRNLSGMRNFVSEALVAAAAQKGQVGNAYDQMLDSLNAAMAARGITYQRVAQMLLSEKTGEKAALLLWGPNTVQGPVGTVPPGVTPTLPTPGPIPGPTPGPIATPAGRLSLSTTALAFGAQQNQTASSARLVRLSNDGNASLTLQSMVITGANAGDFMRSSAGSTCADAMVLAAQASCTYSVIFQPISLGAKAAAVSVTQAGSANVVNITLSGTSQAAPANAVDAAIALALNLANTAIAAVQNFISVTYNAFTNLGQRPAGPTTPLTAPPASTINTANPMNWSSVSTWGGTLPVAGAGLIIPVGTTVVLDTDTPNLGDLTINGTLKFANQDVKLTASKITISATGALMVGEAAAPYANKAIITLTGARPSFAVGTVPANTRGITVLPGGKLELYGASPSPVWTQLDDHAAAGATSLTLKDATNWKADDNVIVGPTDYFGVNPTERLALANTAAGNTLATKTALNKFRWGKMQYMTDNGLSLTPGVYTPPVTPAPTQLDQRAAVGNLSRNIVIQGANDADWINSGFGAHVMVMGLASKVFVDGVEFRRVGQAGAMARYPFHWHMLSYDQATGNYLGDATGQEIRNSAIWDSAQRCVVVHGTNGVKITNNICHNITGHAMFLEDAVERRNVFDGNLVLGVKRPTNANMVLLHEGDLFQSGSSGFWITNPDNIIRNNVVGDVIGNAYWNSFPTTGVGLSRKARNPDLAGTQWANAQMRPVSIPHGIFDNNVGYATGQSGMNTDMMLRGGGPVGDELGDASNGTYEPTFDGRPWDINGARPGGVTGDANTRANFSRMTLYKTNTGYANRVTAPDYPQWVMADITDIYARGSGNDGAFFRGLFIGKSLNDKVGGVDTYPADAKPQAFFATYHSTFQMRDNTFAHIAFEEKKSPPGATAAEIRNTLERNESGVFKSDDYYTEQMERGTVLNSNNKFIKAFAGARSTPANLLTYPAGPNNTPNSMESFSLAGALWDPHGYWGNKGFYWTYDTPFYTSGGGCQPSLFPTTNGKNSLGQYNGQSCPGEFYGVNYERGTDFMADPGRENVAYWPMDIERVDCNTAAFVPGQSWGKATRACRQVVGSGWNSWKLGQMRGASLRQGGQYIMRFPNPVERVFNGTGPTMFPGIKQGTMVNAEGQTVPTSIPKEVSVNFSNVMKDSDSFVFGVSFDGSKDPVGVIGRSGEGKRFQRLFIDTPQVPGEYYPAADEARRLKLVDSLAAVQADTTGTAMWQDKNNNMVWVKVKGGLKVGDWYRIVNFTAPYGQELYSRLGLYIKDKNIPNTN